MPHLQRVGTTSEPAEQRAADTVREHAGVASRLIDTREPASGNAVLEEMTHTRMLAGRRAADES